MEKNNFLKLGILLLSFPFLFSCQMASEKWDDFMKYRSARKLEKEFLKDEKKFPSVGLILGPGSAKALAHVGVLKAIDEMGIPIPHIVGLEWGAFIGALYAQGISSNQLEWNLYKLFRKTSSSFFGSSKMPFPLDSFLKTHAKKSFSNLETSFTCPSFYVPSEKVYFQTRGNLSSSVRRCMDFFPFVTERSQWMAWPSAIEASVKHLKEKGVDHILIVDVLPEKTVKPQKDIFLHFLWSQVREDIKTYELRKEKGVKVLPIVTYLTVSDFKKYRFFIDQGYRQGKELLKQIIENDFFKKRGFE